MHGCGTEENNEDNEDKEDVSLYVSNINIFSVKEVVAATTVSEP